ncbi:MAG: phosphate ABC transporter substrate-binding protein [Nitrospirales bacterium]|nr:phosphate ABC transporter substrate-binding protein [Nitrospirales bacterium]
MMGCESSDRMQNSAKLVITGSSTLAPLVADIGKRFESIHTGVRIDVQTGGSSRGLADVRQGLADIGMMSRPLHATEQDVMSRPIARDGISMIVHQSNPVQALRNEQIIKLYTGKIHNWKEVGGEDAPITVINKAEGRGTLLLFLTYFQLQNIHIRAHVVVGDNEQGIKTVAGNPHSIAYVSIGTAEFDANHGVPIKLLPIRDIPASLDNLQNGTFPLSRSLLFVTNFTSTTLAKDFINFVQSAAVYDLIAQHYFVPISS